MPLTGRRVKQLHISWKCAPLWRAVTCHRFLQATCRCRVSRDLTSPMARALKAPSAEGQVPSRPKTPIGRRTSNRSMKRAIIWVDLPG
jgi:hypothetical protein